MKKIVSLIFLVAFCFGMAAAQDGSTAAKAYKVTADVMFAVKGAAKDTLIKDDYKDFFIWTNPFADVIKVNAKITRTSGAYTKMRVVVMTSYDNLVWVRADSVSVATTNVTTSTRTTAFACKAPYLKIRAYAYDSTATNKIQYFILIDKPS